MADEKKLDTRLDDAFGSKVIVFFGQARLEDVLWATARGAHAALISNSLNFRNSDALQKLEYVAVYRPGHYRFVVGRLISDLKKREKKIVFMAYCDNTGDSILELRRRQGADRWPHHPYSKHVNFDDALRKFSTQSSDISQEEL